MNADLYRVAFAIAQRVALGRRAVAFAIARYVVGARRVATSQRTVAGEKGSSNEPALHRDDAPRPALQSLGHAQHHAPTLRRTQTNPARPRRPRG
jgi:hypothetical protein